VLCAGIYLAKELMVVPLFSPEEAKPNWMVLPPIGFGKTLHIFDKKEIYLGRCSSLKYLQMVIHMEKSLE
jgi:hypothetical protein